jgi:hypothetical protein
MKVSATITAVLVSFMLTLQAKESVANVVSGTIDAVDSGAKTIGVKTVDGTKYTVKLTEKTTVMGADDVAKATTVAAESTALGAKKGSQVVVHYTEKGGERSAQGIKVVGDATLKVSKGTVTAVDHGAKTFSVKTADGAEKTYQLASDGVVEGGKKTADGMDAAGKGTVEGVETGSKVTVHYVDAGGKSVVHGFEHIL